MTINLYSNVSDNRDINKKISLITSGVNCTLKNEECSFEHPIIVLTSNYFNKNCNYAYIPEYDRYYFISDKRFVRGGRVELHLYVDVLYTYREQIKQCVGIVKRSNSQGNNYLPDEMLKVTSQVRTDIYQASGSFNSSLDYVLTVCG